MPAVKTPAPKITAFDTVMELDYAESEIGLFLVDGRTERIQLKTACPTEFIIHEPTVNEDGSADLSLEIIRFDLVGTSEELWPGEEVHVLGGALSSPDGRPILGSAHIPAGRALEEGVLSDQHLFLTIQTPIGTLHNDQAITMSGTLYRLPPKGSRFESRGRTPLLSPDGVEVGTVYMCANEA
jgi:hypothetical protein